VVREREEPKPKNFGLEPYEHDALTVEGQIERETALVAGAKRVGGWRKWVVYGFYVVAGVMLLWTLVAQLLAPFLLDLD
jgi:hypothetical protein